ncbi:unnamed protein product [Fusarium equiseti]|uniref:Uncharacterized protein n=1 Tax=Fusarium equiseti TaxID=61235 RepID=A0A8J2IUY9_FUSEQ|nr:unnamed protein product [Fusarium equiseti]
MDQATNPVNKDSSTGCKPPAPDQDFTAIHEWPSLSDETMVSPVEWVLLRRTEFIAAQLRAVLQGNERIMSMMNKTRSRSSSASSYSSTVTESTENEEIAPSDSINTPDMINAYNALIDVKSDKHAVVVEVHRAFMDETSNKLFVKRTIQSAKAAMNFRDYIFSVLLDGHDEVDKGEDDSLAVLISVSHDFSLLNADLMIDIFISLNKEMKKSMSKAQG